MRKAYFFLLLMCCGTLAVAQKAKRSYTSGLKAGVNLYQLKPDPEVAGISDDMRTNFHAGIFFNVPISSSFSLQPELLYSSQGGKFKGTGYKSERALSYVTLPVLAQFNTKPGFFLEAGPALNVLAKGKETTTNNNVTSELDLKKQVAKANLSAMGGIGFKRKNYGISARYDYGLTRLLKEDNPGDIQSSGIMVSLFWGFGQ